MRIAVVGSGPAGAVAAAHLARAGASVLLFDPSHPREKPCGGGLTGRALSLLSGLIDVAALAPVVVRSAVVESPSPSLASPAAHAEPHVSVALADCGATAASTLLVFSRAVFDRALTDAAIAAGARFCAEKVIDVDRRGAKMIVRTRGGEYPVDFVLGADGANSGVRKKLAAPFDRTQLSVAAGFYVHGATERHIRLQTITEQPGYLWSFPRPDHLAVGICARATSRTASPLLKAQALSWIASHGFRDCRLIPYAWPIPSAGYEDKQSARASGSGWMLLGDAAGLVDPLTREGIYYALLSGSWAADFLARSPVAEAPRLYAERLRFEVQPELARAARLSRLFFSPRFSTLFVEALRASGPVRAVFSDLVAGNQPYRGLRRRLLATGEWRLAARAIRLTLPPFAGTMRSVVSPQAT